MSRRTSARQPAQLLLDEITSLLQQLAELRTENARLRRQLAQAYDGHGVQLSADDEEG